MRIGNLHVNWMSSRKEILFEEQAREFLRSIEGREIVAKMARSEVKNYLAELAEENELPFGDPAAFLAQVRTRLAAALLVERMNKEHGITLDDLEQRHAEADPAFDPLRQLDDGLHIIRGDN